MPATLDTLTPRQRRLMGAFTLNTELGRPSSRATSALNRSGVDPTSVDLTPDQMDTLEKERLARMAGRGARGAQLAKIRGALATGRELTGMVDEFTAGAKVQGIDEVRRGYAGSESMISSAAGGPVDPNSPAFQAVAGQLANERGQAIFQTVKGIEQQGLTAKMGIKQNVDLNIISGALEKIGDIVEMQKALAEAKDAARTAGYAKLAGSAGGALGSLFGPVGASLGSAAGAGAVGGAGGVGGASTSLDALTKYLLSKYGAGSSGTTKVAPAGTDMGSADGWNGYGMA